MDDILITRSTLASIAFIKTALHDAFEMSDLGLLRQFLGLEITQDYDGIMVTQSKYVSYLLIDFNMAYYKAALFPFLWGISLEEGKSTPHMDSTIYRQLIRSFLYLTHSRPDICYIMNDVSRYMNHPHDIHWKESKRILQYIQETRSYDIHYAADSELDLVGFTNSEWAGDIIDQKSTSRYAFMFGGGPIFWSRKK